MYHVDLGLTEKQVKGLKQLALDLDMTVKDLVTRMVVSSIESPDITKLKSTKIKKEESSN
jgi:hypothetical protein